MQIKDSVVFITGANRGLGLAFAKAALAAGAKKVYGAARDAASITLSGVTPVALDVTKPAQVEAAAAACGDVTLLINNAGISRGALLLGSADAFDAARAEFETNFFGMWSVARAFAPVLKANGGGAILNVLSVAGIVAVPNMGGYSPSKFAMRAAGSCIRAELAGQGTSVTSLIVGSVDTRMASHVKGAKEAPEDIARAAMKGITRGVDEIDTDRFAIESRAALARDPKGMERGMAKMLHAQELSTGR